MSGKATAPPVRLGVGLRNVRLRTVGEGARRLAVSDGISRPPLGFRINLEVLCHVPFFEILDPATHLVRKAVEQRGFQRLGDAIVLAPIRKPIGLIVSLHMAHVGFPVQHVVAPTLLVVPKRRGDAFGAFPFAPVVSAFPNQLFSRHAFLLIINPPLEYK